jgi:hypothetical protein
MAGGRQLCICLPGTTRGQAAIHFRPVNVNRNSIRESCASLRKLLASATPVGTVAHLQEVLTIECDALASDRHELRAVEERLSGLMRRLIEQGTIDAERWKEFFGEPVW